MSRRRTSSGGGASSLGYLFGSDSTTLTLPNNRAPPRPQQPSPETSNSAMYTGSNTPKQPQFERDETEYEMPSGYETPAGDSNSSSSSSSSSNGSYAASDMSNAYYSGSAGGAAGNTISKRNCVPQTRAVGKAINDGGGVSLDMSGGSFTGRDNHYLRAEGPNSGNFVTGRPSTRAQVAPRRCSSLGYLFGGA